jgi:hypothetical protein
MLDDMAAWSSTGDGFELEELTEIFAMVDFRIAWTSDAERVDGASVGSDS